MTADPPARNPLPDPADVLSGRRRRLLGTALCASAVFVVAAAVGTMFVPDRAGTGGALGGVILLAAGGLLRRRLPGWLTAARDAAGPFRRIADAAPVLLWVAGSDGRHTFFSRPWLAFTGRTAAEEEGLGWLDGLRPDDLPRYAAAAAAFRERAAFECEVRLRRADGEYRSLLVRGQPAAAADGTFLGLIGSATDVTDLRRAKEAVRESEARFRAFVDHNPAVAWMRDDAGRYVYLSKGYEDRFRVRLADWVGKTDRDLWPAAVADRLRGNDRAVLATARPLEVAEHAPDPDGTPREWWAFKFPFRDAAGRRYVGGTAVDVTARVRAEAGVRASEARYRAIVEAALDGIVTADGDGRVIEFNPAAERAFGYARADVVGRPIGDLFAAGLVPSADRQTGVSHLLGPRHDQTGVRADGPRSRSS